jgi:glycolate oxidase iron-sulfur subunit
MQTHIPDSTLATHEGLDAENILRKCVHCGFCLATCPTYQVLGDELDSPRGRIYLIKDILEGAPVTVSTQLHLDRCLTCQACESTCPSGVEYHELLAIGRAAVDKQGLRSWRDRITRGLLLAVLTHRKRFNFLLSIGQFFRPILPQALQQNIPQKESVLESAKTNTAQTEKVIIFQGCVQPGLAPTINAATRLVLDKLGIGTVTVTDENCCGALSHHLDAQAKARATAKRNIDCWWPYFYPEMSENMGGQSPVTAIVITASGCGTFVKEYADLLKHDPDYAEKARILSHFVKDISEIIDAQKLSLLVNAPEAPIAFHAPCSLQHGQKLTGVVEKLLTQTGFNLQPVNDAHLCCGSAGSYSIFQKELSLELRARKLGNLERGNPSMIATANIGCLLHLKSGTHTRVKHWIEMVAEHLN